MRIVLLVGAGSFIGGVLRYTVSQYIHSKYPSLFPFGTLAVNLVGCAFIGVIFALSERTSITSETRLFLATGVCGGFTTFSAFSYETLQLLQQGQLRVAILYITASVLLGILATFIGYYLLKQS